MGVLEEKKTLSYNRRNTVMDSGFALLGATAAKVDINSFWKEFTVKGSKQEIIPVQLFYFVNPFALREAKIVLNFGFSECSRVKMTEQEFHGRLCHNCKKLFLPELLYRALDKRGFW